MSAHDDAKARMAAILQKRGPELKAKRADDISLVKSKYPDIIRFGEAMKAVFGELDGVLIEAPGIRLKRGKVFEGHAVPITFFEHPKKRKSFLRSAE